MLAPLLKGHSANNMFIYGTCGTGKTICTQFIVKQLLEISEKEITIIYINCKMKNVSDTEYRLLAELSRTMGREVPYTGLPTDRIYQMFFDTIESFGSNVILILDEIDTLVKEIGDGLLYNLTRINENLQPINIQLSIIWIRVIQVDETKLVQKTLRSTATNGDSKYRITLVLFLHHALYLLQSNFSYL